MKYDIQQLIGNTLRIGVTTACAIALIGGLYYLWQHGSEPMPDFTTFSYAEASQYTDYTTFDGILRGVFELTANSWIQLGVLVLMLTPMIRVVFSLFDFVAQRDWIYVVITSIVLAIIIGNSIGGF